MLEHATKVVERIFEHRIWQQIEADDMQFGFMKGKGITDTIFTVRQIQENFRVKGKKLYFGFVDLESVILPIYKEKGDPTECGSYRGIKLLEHAMKVVQRIFEHRIWQQIEVDDIQFGFMKGKGNTDAIFTVSK